jgi:hypothetical protein
MTFLTPWLLAFALTQAIEVPLYAVFLKLPWRLRCAAAFGASALTHPYVWFILPPLLVPKLGYWGYVALVEVLVVIVEAAVFLCLGVPRRRAFLVALAANALSFLAGLLLL